MLGAEQQRSKAGLKFGPLGAILFTAWAMRHPLRLEYAASLEVASSILQQVCNIYKARTTVIQIRQRSHCKLPDTSNDTSGSGIFKATQATWEACVTISSDFLDQQTQRDSQAAVALTLFFSGYFRPLECLLLTRRDIHTTRSRKSRRNIGVAACMIWTQKVPHMISFGHEVGSRWHPPPKTAASVAHLLASPRITQKIVNVWYALSRQSSGTDNVVRSSPGQFTIPTNLSLVWHHTLWDARSNFGPAPFNRTQKLGSGAQKIFKEKQ